MLRAITLGSEHWSVYDMTRDAGRLMDDPRLKQLGVKHEERIARQRFGCFATPIEFLKQFKSSPLFRRTV